MHKSIVDYHLHNYFSSDGSGSVLDFCKTASSLGFTHLAFTNHAEKFSEEEKKYSVNYQEFHKLYSLEKEEIELAKKEYPALDIALGVEIENRWEFFSEIDAIVKNLNFDVVLGSVHVLNGVSISSSQSGPAYMLTQQPEELYDSYFQELNLLVEKVRFDVLAHMDIFKRYSSLVFGEFPLVKYREKIELFFAILAKKGIVLEVNTSGYRQDPKESYPGAEILKIAYGLGVDITLGSDAHSPCFVGAGMPEAVAMLKEIGYCQAAVFHKRQKKMIAI